MTPRIIREPITGTRWVASRPSEVLLSWLPVLVALAAFGLGYFVRGM